MSTKNQIEHRKHLLTTPRAAAVAGIIAGILFTVTLLIMRVSVPETASETGNFLIEKAGPFSLILHLMTFAGIFFFGSRVWRANGSAVWRTDSLPRCSWAAACFTWPSAIPPLPAEPFVELRMPKIFNLRRDPFERADENSNGYWNWVLKHVFIYYGALIPLKMNIESLEEFPPRQKPGSFNLDRVIEKTIEVIHSSHK